MTLDKTKEEMELNIEPEEDGVLCKALEILEDIRDGLRNESTRRTPTLEIEFIDGTDFNFYKLKQIAGDIVELLTNDSDHCI
jgi:hypothetical protein